MDTNKMILTEHKIQGLNDALVNLEIVNGVLLQEGALEEGHRKEILALTGMSEDTLDSILGECRRRYAHRKQKT